MKKKPMLLLAAALTFLAISGCSTPVYEDRYAWSQGWRVGKVTKLIQADEFLKVSGSRCRQFGLGPTDQIAVIRWREVTRTRGHFARVDAGSGMAVGDEVYFNVWDCDQVQMVRKVPP
ncbi:MAG: hypothetical protein EON50_01635 [Acidovorax sp.]|nr:MAG: hypothetical protein EON50_01635 [Acidovorax sp.]